MAISEKMDSLNTELTQWQKVIEARAQLQLARSTIQGVNSLLQTIADGGSFDTVDVEIKQSLVAAWQVLKDAQTALDADSIKTLLDWSP